MPPLTPVVFDASVLIPATVNTSIRHQIVARAAELGGMFLSEYILAETSCGVQEDYGATPEDAAAYIEFLRNRATMVAPAEIPPDACRDKKDLPVLGTAVAANAVYLVSGDNDLTDLGSYNGISIIKPGAYYRLQTGI
jgi:putative PIN family toxin of toxin-antitoxin system